MAEADTIKRRHRGRNLLPIIFIRSRETGYRTPAPRKGSSYYAYFGGEASWDIDSLNLLTAEIDGFTWGSNTTSAGAALMSDAAGMPITATQPAAIRPSRGISTLTAMSISST